MFTLPITCRKGKFLLGGLGTFTRKIFLKINKISKSKFITVLRSPKFWEIKEINNRRDLLFISIPAFLMYDWYIILAENLITDKFHIY